MPLSLSEAELAEVCERYGLIQPCRRQRERHIVSVPRVGQYYWVDFPHDAYAPEFVGEHPGVIVRSAKSLSDVCIVVPITSKPQQTEKHIHRLRRNPDPNNAGRPIWAVCNHLYTIHLARLRTVKVSRSATFPKVEADDINAIFAAIRYAMPRVCA